MQVLLIAINAKYIHSNPAVYSLRSFAGINRKYISIAEYTINNQTQEILADIYNRKPDVIAFSCYIWNLEIIKELLPQLSKILPGIPIWLGGPEVSYEGTSLLEQFPILKGIMYGEGEETFKELLAYYLKGNRKLSAIKGLIYYENNTSDNNLEIKLGLHDCEKGKENKKIIKTKPRKLINMNRLPFLYHNIQDFENRIIYYESSRGCPYQCSYCLSSVDKTVRFRDIQLVKQELQYLLDHKVTQVKFVDRTFNCNHVHAMEIWKYIQEHDNGITNFHFEIAADLLKQEEINLLATMRPGLLQFEIGVQSTHPKTLEVIRRKMDTIRLREVTAAMKRGNNIHIHLDLIAGLPYEDYDTFIKSFQEVYAMEPEQLQLGFLKVLKGSQMHDKAEEYGIVYGDKPPYEVLFTKWLPYDKVLRLKQVEKMVDLYYNSNQFTHTLKALQQVFQHSFDLFDKLADYYDQNGYFINSPARAYRYQVLHDFACFWDKNREAYYKELLTYDLYLRENVKSRPEFGADLQPFRESIREFYKEEEKNRRYLLSYGEYNARQMMKMTHMEVFTYSVREEGSKTMDPKKLDNPEYILFDYQQRNPLTGDAVTYRIEGDNHAREILELLDARYGTDFRCFLHHENAWQLLIATMLSAQCTDARVNIVTKDLFQKYTCIEDFAEADLKELEEAIHSTGFYHNKAKNIIACCKAIRDRFGGEVPRSIEDLTSLAGVGRKTANVVRGNIYHDPSIVVDTHVKRISKKLGLTMEEDPVKVEMDLMKVLPKDHWILYNIQIITLGREICKAPTPKCDLCFLQNQCQDYQNRNQKRKDI